MQRLMNTTTMILFLSSSARIRIGHAFRAGCPLQRCSFHSSTSCQLNRFLFDPSEVISEGDGNCELATPTVILPKDDYRTIHAAKTLGLHNGDTVRAGLVSCNDHDGLLTDEASIQWIPEGNVKKAEPLGNGDPPGSISIRLDNLQAPASSDKLLVSLILALPRPLQLARMLPMISQMGVDDLVLTRSRKVPKDYFGSHLFRKPEVMREKIIEGLCQAGDVRLPQLHIVKNLRGFLDDDLDHLFPRDTYARVIAHPQRAGDTREPLRMGQIEFPTTSPPRVVIAVGPEGGWEEPDELERFQELGFQQITLGTRTLRSDCAVVSLLSLANEVCVEREDKQ